jgi:hypothetical protein
MLPERLPAPVGIDRSAKIEKPRQHTSCVRFDDRNGLTERKACNRVRGVFADSGKRLHSVDCAWKLSAVSIHHRFCSGVEISRAA